MRPRVHANPFADFGSANGRSYSINHRSNHKWFEVDLFSEGGNKSIKNRINDLIVETKKVNLWLIFLFIGILILVVRTGYLQLVEG